jgi:hypothetical protein
MFQWYTVEDGRRFYSDDSDDIKNNEKNSFDPYWNKIGGVDHNNDIKIVENIIINHCDTV